MNRKYTIRPPNTHLMIAMFDNPEYLIGSVVGLKSSSKLSSY